MGIRIKVDDRDNLRPGFKFNDWIIMNTEIEFEDGGSRSDGTKNYKYAIVEFSYLDLLFDKAYALRIGHILVPMGLTNLNHEPVAYLTSERIPIIVAEQRIVVALA